MEEKLKTLKNMIGIKSAENDLLNENAGILSDVNAYVNYIDKSYSVYIHIFKNEKQSKYLKGKYENKSKNIHYMELTQFGDSMSALFFFQRKSELNVFLKDIIEKERMNAVIDNIIITDFYDKFSQGVIMSRLFEKKKSYDLLCQQEVKEKDIEK